MNDVEREAAQLLSCYVKEERPPPGVDVMVRARLRDEARRRTTRRWIAVWAVAAALVLVLWALGSAGLQLRTFADAASAALHAAESPDTRGSVVKAARPRSKQPSPAPPEPEPEPNGDPGVEALREAHGLMRAGNFEAAFERLEPCEKTVGTDDLVEDCEYIAAQALCRFGNVVEGRRRAAIFRSRWPNSSHVKILSIFCPS